MSHPPEPARALPSKNGSKREWQRGSTEEPRVGQERGCGSCPEEVTLAELSIPHTAANKNLILAASDTRVRILEGKEVIATHQRSYDRGEVVEDPAHKKALLKLRRRAQSSSAMQQLTAQIPEAELFLQGAFDKGE